METVLAYIILAIAGITILSIFFAICAGVAFKLGEKVGKK